MEYNRIGLKIILEELEALLERAKNASKYDSMENVVYIKVQSDCKPRIIQYCNYAECGSIDHTYLAR